MKVIESKRWIIVTFIQILVATIIMSTITYIIDPHMYYSSDDNYKKLLNSRFINIGLIKNVEYDTAIIGSSMIQNFDMQSFRNKLGWNPVKLTVGGMTANEIVQMYVLSRKYSHANRYLINIDLQTFNKDINFKIKSEKFPSYLYNESKIDDFKYLMGYDTWLKFIPVDIGITLAYKKGITLPEKFDDSIQIDMIDNWSKDYSFGKDVVITNYMNSRYSVSQVNNNGMVKRMKENLDGYFNILFSEKYDQEFEIIFLFPPYSVLYWVNAEKEEYIDQFFEFKRYFLEKAKQYPNVRVVDVQDLSLSYELDHYKDTTHYDTVIQEIIVDVIVNGKYDLNDDNICKKQQRLRDMVSEFKRENTELFSEEALLTDP